MSDVRSERRRDAFGKVTGRASYTVDLDLPFMAHSAVVRSERAHATILDIDVSAARGAPGVIAIVVGKDLVGAQARFGHIIPDHPVLAIDKVRYHGEPVALVVAETVHEAADAAGLVVVDYDDVEPLMDAVTSLASDTLIHSSSYVDPDAGFLEVAPAGAGNVAHRVHIGWGDVDEAMTTAERVVTNTVEFPMLYAYAMETYTAIADHRGDSLHVISTAQHPMMVRKELARMFGLPLAAVRVQVPYVGGGYGSKSYTKLEPLATVGSWAAGRPVKVTTDVEGAINTTRVDAARVTMSTGFDGSGHILARDVSIVLDSGAYADNSPLVLTKCANRCFGPYRVPALRVTGEAVYTNTTPASSYRGFGAPQGALAGELNLDIAAGELGLDPVELRRRNLVGPGEVILPGKRPLDADLRRDLDLVVDALDTHAGVDRPGIRRGRAVALSASDAGAAPLSTALVRVHADGSATLLTSSTELGQGSNTALAQIVARELDLDLASVAVGQSDTLYTPWEWTTGASRTTTVTGLAIQAACADVRTKTAAALAELEHVSIDQVTLNDGKFGVTQGADAGGGSTSGEGPQWTMSDVVQRWFDTGAGELVGVGVVRKDGVTKSIPPFWEIGVIGVEVAVDTVTGEVAVDHLVIVGDVGHAVNPGLVEGQDLGAATQGIGAALWEELIYDGQQLANPNLVEYRVPRFRDIPKRITSLIVERADGVGPYGLKGSGEGATNPIPAAIASAVGRATGRWPTTLPLTPQRVWTLLNEGDTGDRGRDTDGGES